MLLQLPPEVLVNILWHMDPGTLLVCLFVSKRFLELAHSRRILLHQLRSLPGLTVGLEELSTYDAFMLFRRRATQNLSGGSVLAQRTRYSTGRCKVNVRLCVFYDGDPACLAVAYRDRSVIRLYDFTEQSIRPKADLDANIFQGEEPDCHIQLLKVTFSEARDVAGLYRYTPHIWKGGPMVKTAFLASRAVLKLVVFKYIATPTNVDAENDLDENIYSPRQETRDIRIPFHSKEIEPVGLAISKDGLACVAWPSAGHYRTGTIWLYARNADLMGVCGYGQSTNTFLDSSSCLDFSHQSELNLPLPYCVGNFYKQWIGLPQLTPCYAC